MAIEEVISVDAGPAIAGLDALAAAAESAASKFESAMSRLKVPAVGGGGADKLAASMDAAAAKVDAAVSKIQAAFDKLAGMGDSAAAGLEKIGEAADSAAGPLDAIAGAADEAAAAQDRLAESADAAGGALDRTAVAGVRAGAAADDAAAGAAAGAESHSKLGEYALGAAVVLGFAADQAMKFNGSMTLLNTQAGVSARQMPALTKGVLELAGATGQSPGNLAESLYHVASNMESMPGTTTAQMLNAVKIAAEGAAVGHSNLTDTTTALTSVIASGIPGAKNYSQAMGALNATVGVGEMNMQQLSEAMGTGVVPVVKGYGLTLKDVGAALATYGDLNIRGAKAGTELRMAVQALAVPASTATGELSKLGLSTTSLSKDMESGGLLKALDDLNGKFKAAGITAKDEGAVITELFGKKAGAGLALLLENMDRVQSKYPALTKGANDFGQAWEKTQGTAQQRLKQLESGAEAMAITLGNIALPAANTIMGGLDKAMEFVQSHAFASKGLTLGLGTLIAGGLAKGIFSGVESGLSGIGKLGSLLKIPGLDKLANIGQASGAAGASTMAEAAAGNKAAADTMASAAAGFQGAADTMAAAAAGNEKAADSQAADLGLLGLGKGKGGTAGEAALGEDAIGAGLMSKLGISSIGDVIGPALLAVIGTTIVDSVLKNTKSGPGGKNWLDNPFGENPASKNPRAQGVSTWAGLGDLLSRPVEDLFHDIFGSPAPKPPPGKDWTSVLGGMGGQAAPNIPASQFATPPPPAQLSPHPGSDRYAPVPGAALIPQGLPNEPSAALLGAGGHPGTVTIKVTADTSSADAAKGKVSADVNALNQAATSLKPIKFPAPDLSALTAAAGKTQAAGAAAGAGFAAGIASETGAAAAAGAALAAAAESAMKVHLQISSPSKVTQEIGSQTVQGYIQGLEGGQSDLQDATQALIGTLANPDAVSSIQQTVQQLISSIPASDTGLVKYLTAQQGKLTSLANQQGKLMTEISDAQQVATSAISGASITSASGYTPALAASNGPQASQSIITGMQQQLADTKSFASQLGQLQKMGLNATTESQLAQAGTAAGLPLAMGLAQGGKGAVQQINAIEKQIIGASQKIGGVGGTAMYQAGLQVTDGLASGLKAQLKQVDNDMAKIANQIISTVQKKLGTGSSAASGGSTAAGTTAAATTAVTGAAGAGGLGKLGSAAGGAAAGLSSAGTAAGRAATGLGTLATAATAAAGALGKIAAAQPPGGGHGGGGGLQPMSGGGGGGGGGHVTVHQPVTVHVYGTVVSNQDLADHVQSVLLSKNSNNWQAGLVYPGRAV